MRAQQGSPKSPGEVLGETREVSRESWESPAESRRSPGRVPQSAGRVSVSSSPQTGFLRTRRQRSTHIPSNRGHTLRTLTPRGHSGKSVPSFFPSNISENAFCSASMRAKEPQTLQCCPDVPPPACPMSLPRLTALAGQMRSSSQFPSSKNWTVPRRVQRVDAASAWWKMVPSRKQNNKFARTRNRTHREPRNSLQRRRSRRSSGNKSWSVGVRPDAPCLVFARPLQEIRGLARTSCTRSLGSTEQPRCVRRDSCPCAPLFIQPSGYIPRDHQKT